MDCSILIATYGDPEWESLAMSRAYPSATSQGAREVLVKHEPEQSIAEVRNSLAEKATGEWLCFLDADDELAPGYLEAMERIQKRQRDGAVLLTPAVMQIRQGRRRRPSFYPEVNLLSGNWLIVGTLLTRSLFFEAQGFSDYPHGFEDWSLWSKCTKLGARVVKVPRAIYVQHVNPNSKHRQGWKDRKWQVATHQRVQAELEAWQPA